MTDETVIEVFKRAMWREGSAPERLLKVAERAVWRANDSDWDWVDRRLEARVARTALRLRVAAFQQELSSKGENE